MREAVTPARARRIVLRANLSFQDHVQDPRDVDRVKHGLRGILNLLAVGFAAGKKVLRDIEDVSSDLKVSVLRALGLTGAVSDTTLYELLVGQSPDGFREVLHEQVKNDLRSKAIRNDVFPGGVLTIDGKGAGSGYGEAPNSSCRETVCDKNGTKVWHLYCLRAVLTSSSACPCLDQEFLNSKTGETTAFPGMLERTRTAFPKLFRYVTSDAEFPSAKNAAAVLANKKVYVFGLKANRRRLFDLANRELPGAPVVASTTERTRGGVEHRELRRARCPAETNFPGAEQFWAIRRTEFKSNGTSETEERIFITATPWDELSPEQCLQLVRLHWMIENGSNWTADVILKEDSHSPCNTGNGVLIVSWLRLLAYNLVSVFRAYLPQKDRRPQSWRRSMELLYHAFLSSVAFEKESVVSIV